MGYLIQQFRKIAWKLLGVDYDKLKRLNDITSLCKDRYAKIGCQTYHNGAYVSRSSNASLDIGKYTSIAKGVWFVLDDNFHQSSPITTSPLQVKFSFDMTPRLRRKWKGIKIGNDVWIGMNAIIMPDVTIGNGVIIGANTVVTKDVEAYSVVVGSPAKVVKRRFNEDEINILETIKWWDWPEEIMKKRVEDFYLNKDEFFEKYSND